MSREDSAPGSTVPPQENVLLLGTWKPPESATSGALPDVAVHHCPDPELLPARAHVLRIGWLLVGAGLDDPEIRRAFTAARAIREDSRLAVLGASGDWRRCERWLRQGCSAYLHECSDLQRVGRALALSRQLDTTVIDRVFQRGLQPQAISVPVLTRREREVLDLLQRGMRNRDISASLFITENTVEYHMRHLLQKLSARNRLEAVERATTFGLL